MAIRWTDKELDTLSKYIEDGLELVYLEVLFEQRTQGAIISKGRQLGYGVIDIMGKKVLHKMR